MVGSGRISGRVVRILSVKKEVAVLVLRPPLLNPNGVIAQSGERLVCNQKVKGSIPFNSTKWFWDVGLEAAIHLKNGLTVCVIKFKARISVWQRIRDLVSMILL